MKYNKSLFKLLRSLIAALLIFGVFSTLLIVERQGLSVPSAVRESGLIDEDTWYEVRNENAGEISSSAPQALIIYDEKDEESAALKDNVQYVLNTLYVNTDCVVVLHENEDDEQPSGEIGLDEGNEEVDAEEGTVEPSDSINAENVEQSTIEIPFSDFQDLIICISDLSVLSLNMDELEDWVSAGGHIMFTEVLDSNEYLLPWLSLLGIENTDKIPTEEAESLVFSTDIIAGAQGMEFSDDVIMCTVLSPILNSACTVHISTSTENEVPLLWEYQFGEGKIIVCNADIMESKVDRGIVAAAYCKFYPAYIYPVINAAVYCIDDFPSPSPAGYEENVLAQYGYSVSDFYANVWMPAMQDIAEKYDIRFSTFAIQTYEDNVDGPFDNDDDYERASYYANIILNMGGEVGIHGYNHQPLVLDDYVLDDENDGYTPWSSVRNMIDSLKTVISYTESLNEELYVESYVAPSNVISSEALQEMIAQLEDIRVYAGVYSGTPDQFIQEYSVLENGAVYCPRLTADMQMEDSEWWTQINELNFHYVESNFIHPDDLMDEDRSDGGDFSQMLAGYEDMIAWNTAQGLRATTISEAGAAVQRYANLSISQKMEGNILTVNATGLIDEAYMMLRTNGKRPTSISSGTITALSDDIYIVKICEETVTITLVDKS